MKNKITFCLLFLFSLQLLQAQNNWTKTETIAVNAKFDLYQDQWQVKDEMYSKNSEAVSLESIELIDKELIISYTSTMPEGGQYFNTSIEIQLDNQVLNIEPENFLGAINKELPFSQTPQRHQIVWTNLTDNYIQLAGFLPISLITEIYGNRKLPYNVDCGIEPTFQGRQKMPFYIAGLVGAGSILSGRYFETKSQEEYAIYLNGETANEPIFQAANNKRHTGLILTYSGAAILAADAIWFLVRQRRYKKQLDTYKEFCNPNTITIRPYFEPSLNNPFALQPGCKLSYNF